jgi:hypothetical protein
MIPPDEIPRYSTKEAADYLGVTASNLHQMRHRGQGPAYHKVGARVFYTLRDIIDYLSLVRVVPPNPPSPRGHRLHLAETTDQEA